MSPEDDQARPSGKRIRKCGRARCENDVYTCTRCGNDMLSLVGLRYCSDCTGRYCYACNHTNQPVNA